MILDMTNILNKNRSSMIFYWRHRKYTCQQNHYVIEPFLSSSKQQINMSPDCIDTVLSHKKIAVCWLNCLFQIQVKTSTKQLKLNQLKY